MSATRAFGLCSALLAVCLAAGLAGCPAAETAAPTPDAPAPRSPAAPAAWLVDVTGPSGIAFTHETGATGAWLLPEIMASGCALLDADDDGDLDVYFTNGAWTDGRDSEPPRHALYLQIEPWRFELASEADASALTGYGLGVATGDYDGDGRTDLYVCQDGPDRLLRNLGHGAFEDVTASAGIAVSGWTSTAAFVDYDEDGDLDLFVVRYVDFDPSRHCTDSSGRPDYCGPKSFPPLTDVLLRNDGDRFTDVSAASGLAAQPGPGLGVVCGDLDGDDRVDLYVSNDGAANHLWHNRGDGTFEEQALLAGCAFNLHGQSEAGMGLVCADLDDDGRRDLFVTHQARESNTLYLGTEGGFNDATGTLGLAAPSLPYTGFGAAAIDLDCDGRLELLAVGGRVLRGDDVIDFAWPSDVPPPWDRYAEPNLLFRWSGSAYGLDGTIAPDLTTPVEVSRGLATGDLDGDGDLDVVMTNAQGPARIYRNDAPRAGHWIMLRAVERSGADAIGAVVRLKAGARTIERDVITASSYQSASAAHVHVGLGDVARLDEITVRWSDGTWERFAPPGDVDHLVALHRGAGVAP